MSIGSGAVTDSKRRRGRSLFSTVAVIWLAADVAASAQAPSLRVREAAPVEVSAQARNGPRLRPGEPIPPSELEAFVDATVRVGMDEANVAGVAVSVVQDGRITGLIGDLTGVFRDWPGALLATASSGALAASALTLFCALLLPAVWRGAPGLTGWTIWRKGRYTAAVAIFAAFAILLGVWGALEPWAS